MATVALDRPAARRRWRDSAFFLPAALILLALVVWGFGPTFFWAAFVPPPHPSMLTDRGTVAHWLFLVHGVVFTAWILLYVAQSGLVAARRTSTHKWLGLGAMAVAPAVVVLGATAAIEGARVGFHGGAGDPAAFAAASLIAAVAFGAFVAAGMTRRRIPASHKRWLLLATMTLTGAATARIDAINALTPTWFDATALLLPALAGWDAATLRRLHPVTLWGGMAFLIVDMGAAPLAAAALRLVHAG